ncbi:hypothetical protein SLEP1_g39075 [Rubroshorea leprosula]|uniref:Uncharacterized protein n=1 Tax=Rubroshorea leprosula TaxID=152421 RepID=A0AAV5KZ27_9ROSI|nr:hypothetical protein SLEP1_g39075 [Rubroshorea leprosula]
MGEEKEATLSSLSEGLAPRDQDDVPKSPPHSPNSFTCKNAEASSSEATQRPRKQDTFQDVTPNTTITAASSSGNEKKASGKRLRKDTSQDAMPSSITTDASSGENGKKAVVQREANLFHMLIH